MSAKSGGGIAGIDREIEALAASTRETATDAGAVSPSVADEAIREIGQQVSQALSRFVPSGTGKFALDIHGAVGLYETHLQTYKKIREARRNQDKSRNENERQIQGKVLEEYAIHDRKMAGYKSYTTDELAIMKDDRGPEYDRLVKRHPRIAELAQVNHKHTDIITITPMGIVTDQVKNLDKPSSYFLEFKKDLENDQFYVPSDKYDSVKADLDKRAGKGGADGKLAKEFLRKLERASVGRWETRNPRPAQAGKVAQDAATRTGRRIGVGLATDVASIAIGGVAWEIREAYRDPGAMKLMDRVKRLLRVVWSKIRAAIGDRTLRELGFEALSIGVSMLKAPLKLAKAALSRISSIVKQLWKDFVEGKIKSLADVISAILKAVYSAACIGVAIAVERYLSGILGVVPGGEMLSAALAAAVAGAIIVIGNRGVEAIVRTLAVLSTRAALARRRRVEIERFCAQAIPRMIADRDRLEELVDRHLADRRIALDRAFADMAAARDDEDIERFLGGLTALNAAWGKALQWSSLTEFDALMESDEPLKL